MDLLPFWQADCVFVVVPVVCKDGNDGGHDGGDDNVDSNDGHDDAIALGTFVMNNGQNMDKCSRHKPRYAWSRLPLFVPCSSIFSPDEERLRGSRH